MNQYSKFVWVALTFLASSLHVLPPAAAQITDATCSDQSDALEACMEEAGKSWAANTACETCISSSITGDTLSSGTTGCSDDPAKACEKFVNCDCGGCHFEAAAWGSCAIDKNRGEEDCPTTDCSEQVAQADSSAAFSIGSVFYLFGGALLVSSSLAWKN